MMNSKRLSLALLVLSFIGFADAAFLTIKHYTGAPIPCSILDGCDTVTNSVYSQIASVPVALIGALFYLTVFVLALVNWQLAQPGRKLVKMLWWLSLVAFLASLGLVYLQGFVIKAWCLYCLISALISTLIFLSTSALARRV